MKKSLISVAVLAALSSTQVNAGGPHYNRGIFDATCVQLGESKVFVNARFKQLGKSNNFLVTGVNEVTDEEACEISDEFLTDQDISFDSDDEDSGDEDSGDEDSDDDSGDDSGDDDSGDDDSDDEGSVDEDSDDEDSGDEDSDDDASVQPVPEV